MSEERVISQLSSGEIWLSSALVESVGLRVVEALNMPASSDSLEEVELRCPTGPRKLFAKLRLSRQEPAITSDNLIEMACQDCRRRLRTSEDRDVAHVLHRFDISGALVETVYVNRES